MHVIRSTLDFDERHVKSQCKPRVSASGLSSFMVLWWVEEDTSWPLCVVFLASNGGQVNEKVERIVIESYWI